MMRLRRDLLPGCALLTLAGGLYVITTNFGTVPASFAQGMQAADMPRLIIGVIVVLVLVMMAQGRGHEEEAKPAISWRMWATSFVLLISVFLFDVLGLTLTTVLTCLIIPLLWGERRRGAVVLYAIAVPACIYLLFTHALLLRLPQGVLSPWLS
ncbi:tripartite tricarboxylate transporter TctB family protein [Halomonas sp. DP8Y7-1]|uniref:tripartite tricarboxylate transporter TctB family protein n=1 Tax=Halomonas sp. DP8Y7-1 TaxID=2859078 RepID=UPI001C974DBA|nr:tripartite tricarboxylate transporter TctB family protein [Halomonas sp. DP8Y7-1]MBY6031277.1 tripartite tricarboxylate transporter TctB family protein [Halomonas sp. DP8Y7-1]